MFVGRARQSNVLLIKISQTSARNLQEHKHHSFPQDIHLEYSSLRGLYPRG